MVCPFKMANCDNHDTWEEEYGDTYNGNCIQYVWDFCNDPINPENFKPTRVSKELRRSDK